MRPRQKAHGRSLSTKGVQKTKEDLEGLSTAVTALPKRTDIVFEQFAAVLADPIRGEASPPSVLSHVWSFLKERCKPGSPAGTSLVISISGGVDSMVLSHCMIILRNQWGLNLSAVHIDYNIRPSSQVEAAFVETWARKVALPLTMVRLNSTESLNLSRTAFEDFSRRARYEAYEKVMQNRAMAVLTGHHVDDAAENVLSNLFMGRSLFHIPVMAQKHSLSVCAFGVRFLVCQRERFMLLPMRMRSHIWRTLTHHPDEGLFYMAAWSPLLKMLLAEGQYRILQEWASLQKIGRRLSTNRFWLRCGEKSISILTVQLFLLTNFRCWRPSGRRHSLEFSMPWAAPCCPSLQ